MLTLLGISTFALALTFLSPGQVESNLPGSENRKNAKVLLTALSNFFAALAVIALIIAAVGIEIVYVIWAVLVIIGFLISSWRLRRVPS